MLLPTLPRMQAIMTADTRKYQNECRQYGHARFVALRPRLRRLSNGDPTLTKSTSRLARRGKPVRHEQWISHLHLVEPEIRLPLPGTYFAGENTGAIARVYGLPNLFYSPGEERNFCEYTRQIIAHWTAR